MSQFKITPEWEVVYVEKSGNLYLHHIPCPSPDGKMTLIGYILDFKQLSIKHYYGNLKCRHCGLLLKKSYIKRIKNYLALEKLANIPIQI